MSRIRFTGAMTTRDVAEMYRAAAKGFEKDGKIELAKFWRAKAREVRRQNGRQK